MFSSTEPFGFSVMGAHRGWIVGWVGQLSVLEPWNVTTLAVPRLLKHLHVASICNMGINSVLQPPVLYVQCIRSEI